MDLMKYWVGTEVEMAVGTVPCMVMTENSHTLGLSSAQL